MHLDFEVFCWLEFFVLLFIFLFSMTVAILAFCGAHKTAIGFGVAILVLGLIFVITAIFSDHTARVREMTLQGRQASEYEEENKRIKTEMHRQDLDIKFRESKLQLDRSVLNTDIAEHQENERKWKELKDKQEHALAADKKIWNDRKQDEIDKNPLGRFAHWGIQTDINATFSEVTMEFKMTLKDEQCATLGSAIECKMREQGDSIPDPKDILDVFIFSKDGKTIKSVEVTYLKDKKPLSVIVHDLNVTEEKIATWALALMDDAKTHVMRSKTTGPVSPVKPCPQGYSQTELPTIRFQRPKK